MTIKLPGKNDLIKVVSRIDSALVSDEQAYKLYQETLDESHLQYKPGEEPTRFVLKKVLNYDQAQKVKNEQTKVVNGQINVQMSFMAEDVRLSLIDIENPAYVNDLDKIYFKKDADGGASKELMSLLEAADVVNDLYSARHAKPSFDVEGVKKS